MGQEDIVRGQDSPNLTLPTEHYYAIPAIVHHLNYFEWQVRANSKVAWLDVDVLKPEAGKLMASTR